MPIEVRTGRLSDVDAALAVWREASTARRGVAPPDHEARIRASLQNPDTFLSIAEDGPDVIGMAEGMQALDDDGAGPPLPGRCHVSAVFVRPDRWGQGVGARLVQRVLAEGAKRGYSTFQLWTQEDNQRAQRLYEHHGFVRSGREKDDDFGERIFPYVRPPEPSE